MEESKYKIKVYKIWYEDAPDEIYIGSTKESRLSNRMTWHRRDARGRTSKIYQTIRRKGNDFKYCLIASCMVSCMEEQRMFEQEWIDKMKPTLNMIRAYASEDDKKNTNRVAQIKYKQTHPEYRRRPVDRERANACQKKYYRKPGVKELLADYYKQPEQKKKHKDYISEAKRTCICGGVYYDIPCRRAMHFNTKWHQEFVSGLPFFN
jgi:hypothetical protein